MRKLLLLFTMLLAAIVVKAKPINWTDGTYTVTGADPQGQNQKQTLAVSGPGALAAFVAATKDLPGGPPAENEPLLDLGKDANRSNLVITGELNADDLAALNSAVSGCGNLANFKTLDLSGATITLDDGETLSGAGMNMAGLEYLRLPNSMTSADDVVEMGKLKQNGNANLKMVGAYGIKEKFDKDGNYASVALYSWEADNVPTFLTQMSIPTMGNPNPPVCEVRMAGEYGEKDLVSNGATGTPNFGYGTENSAIWDFTGAHFADITISESDAKYYSYDDPFCENGLVAPSTTSNSFIYFSQYKVQAVDVKLPDNNMTHLPKGVFYELAKTNEMGYVALYGQDAFDANRTPNEGVAIETLVIPNCYTDLDEGCGELARIRHLIVGSGVKRIHGGAFLGCPLLEDLDFASGINNCYIGDRSFNECNSMKHIALSEGIVSIGNGAFWNSQHLESIRLPESLRFIGNDAFNNCLALNSITIPANVEQIGQRAFTLCPFTDIYLATEDPTKLPLIWSAGISENGNGFGSYDTNSTFYHMHLDGWDGIPDTPQKATLEAMDWEEATEYYYTHVNGIPVFHYNEKVADAVWAQISATYAATTTDGYGLPLRSDMYKRSNVEGADLGTVGTGKYTRDGWAQFMLMKEFTTDPGGDVYKREYEDVWYTMCFPFDLTDEQLAAAFNETFNIVDFSGVEYQDETQNEEGKKTLILHFNTVAKTYYRDKDGNEYEVIGRELDPTSGFNYNIYRRNGVEYHHSQVSSFLSSNKTKTFAPGSSISESNANKDQAIFIDGYLATAGHPYMIHPAIGTSLGSPKTSYFSGIEWKPQTQWASIFEAQKRTVDLGKAKGTITDDPKTCVPDADNFLQAAYSQFDGQTYTFVGNAKQYSDDCPEEPYVGHGLEEYPDQPTKAAYPTEPQQSDYPYPTEPVAVEQPTITLDDFQAQNKPADVTDPGITWTEADEALYAKLTSPNDWELVWYGETIITATYNDGSSQWNAWSGKKHLFQNLSGVPDPYGNEEGCFNKCKTTFNNKAAVDAYNKYLIDKAAYDEAYAELEAAWNAWNAFDPAAFAAEHSQWEQDCAAQDAAYTAAHTQWEQDCAAIDAAYASALADWEDECDAVDERNAAAHAAWEATAVGYQRLIPTGAYFLGRQGTNYPKYYREIADDTRSGATSGFWTQFTAVIIPNDAAKNGIETLLGEGTAATANQTVNMVFDEGFTGDFVTTDEIEQIITEAENEGQKVEYMQVVYNINGQIVREGTELTGLPKGIYIVNGKKYFVK